MRKLFRTKKQMILGSGLVAAVLIPEGLAFAATAPSKLDQSSIPTQQSVQNQLNNNQITGDINTIVNFLSALVGVTIVANIIIGGIQYSMAGGNPQATQDAKHRITNALMTLLIFFFLWALINWLVPGGVF